MAAGAERVIGVLRHLVDSVGGGVTAIGGEIGFVVHGTSLPPLVLSLDSPGGHWSVVEPGQEERLQECNTRVYAFSDAFGAMLGPPEHLRSAVRRGRILVDGDPTKLTLLGSLIASGGGLIAIRASKTQPPKRRKRKLRK